MARGARQFLPRRARSRIYRASSGSVEPRASYHKQFMFRRLAWRIGCEPRRCLCRLRAMNAFQSIAPSREQVLSLSDCALRNAPVHKHLLAQPILPQTLTSRRRPARRSPVATLEVGIVSRTMRAPSHLEFKLASFCISPSYAGFGSPGFVGFTPKMYLTRKQRLLGIEPLIRAHVESQRPHRLPSPRLPGFRRTQPVLPPTPRLPRTGDTGPCI